MATLTVVVGLPGSGKTYLSNHLAQAHGLDVFHDVLARNLLADENGGFCNLLKALQAGRNCVANEICLVHEDKRKTFKHLLHMIFENTVTTEWIFFANDKEQCVKNVLADTEKLDSADRIKSIEYYSQDYKIPDGIEARSVHKRQA